MTTTLNQYINTKGKEEELLSSSKSSNELFKEKKGKSVDLSSVVREEEQSTVKLPCCVEKCISDCKAHGRICPSAAKAASKAAYLAQEELYKNSLFFTSVKQKFKMQQQFLTIRESDISIRNKIGEGGFSMVHQVKLRDTITPAEKKRDYYAIKFLKPKTMKDHKSFKMGAADLVIEANFLANLHHDHIVKLYGVKDGSIEDNILHGIEQQSNKLGYFILIEYLTDTLEEKIKQWNNQEQQQQLTKTCRYINPYYRERKECDNLMERLKITLQLSDAMTYLHSMNIIYRDLKPANIGFNKIGQLKLFDFGLSKELKRTAATTKNGNLYKLTSNTGSRRYMAPEVAKSEPYNQFVDVYSFGILLYEVSSLEKPFQGYSSKKHMKQVLLGGERPPTKILPLELQRLLKECWSTNINQRPSFTIIRNKLDSIVTKYTATTITTKNKKKSGAIFNNTLGRLLSRNIHFTTKTQNKVILF